MGLWFWLPTLLRALAAIIEILNRRAFVSEDEFRQLHEALARCDQLRASCAKMGMRVPDNPPAT